MADKVSVQISESTWRELNVRRDPGDSFEDVIQGVLEDAGRVGGENEQSDAALAYGDDE